MTFTTSVRLGGQLSAGPSAVFDQSFARMSADISEMEGIECWVIVGAWTCKSFHSE
jgi:hypothetical protein